MNTVILKWNPAFSSYEMWRYLLDLRGAIKTGTCEFNWSVWDFDKIHAGDRFYWVKLGYGQTGIVSSGLITSEPYRDVDWSGKGRETYYVDFVPDVMLNPDTLPILTSHELSDAIPDFDWFKGHSGMVLSEDQALRLENVWQSFLEKNNGLLEKAHGCRGEDQLFMDLGYKRSFYNYLDEELTEDNCWTVFVGREVYFKALEEEYFCLPITEDNYKDIIGHVDGKPTILEPKKSRKDYGIHWCNDGVFPFSLREDVKYLKLVYGNQYFVAEIDPWELDTYHSGRYSIAKSGEYQSRSNGAYCNWFVEISMDNIVAKVLTTAK